MSEILNSIDQENEINPEIENEILKKVQDINSAGIAFHWDIDHNIASILQNGLLGYGSKEASAKKLPAYFNITGKIAEVNILRSFNPNLDQNDLELSYYSSLGTFLQPRKSDLIILFKTGSTTNEGEEENPNQSRGIDGFSTNEPIKCENFTGLVIANSRKATDEEKARYTQTMKSFYEYQIDQLKPNVVYNFTPMDKIIDPTIKDNLPDLIEKQSIAYRENPENLLPIYDIKGNLLWPKQMDYQQVKDFIQERDEKKSKP